MPASAVDAALAAGSWVVTPGERLAREIAITFDDSQRARDAGAWPMPQAVSWNALLDRLWLAALAGAAFDRPPILVAPAVATEIWRKVIGEAAPSLLSARGAAREAARAWHTFHAWRESAGEALPSASGGDCESFLRWSAAYRERLEALEAIDRAALPDLLARYAAPPWLAGFARVLLHAFDALTPQQERLVAAIRAAGVDITRSSAVSTPGLHCERIACPSPRDELAQALAGARKVVESDAAARVAIVVADLEERRDVVEALAEEALCPEHLEHFAPDVPRPYAISYGRALAKTPMVAAALDLIALGGIATTDSMRAARALRTPFLPDAGSFRAARGAVELRWRISRRRNVDFPAAVTALRGLDPGLARRWHAVERIPASPRLPREWARAWTAWLVALGWPGNRPLSSAEWQAREAWTRLLGTFAALGTATGLLGADAALARLAELAAEQLFQPQSPIPAIRILGIEESLGLAFDRAWLVGFDDERWPAPARPNPWLPLAWQSARGVPEATPAGVLARARRMTVQLAAVAPRVVASHASSVDGSERSISPLLAHWPETRTAPNTVLRSQALQKSRRIGTLADLRAPPVVAGGRLRGGASLIESQSACPFQAFARHRLGIAGAPAITDGIGYQERGKLVHAALAAFWIDTGSSAALASLFASGLAAKIESAVQAAIAKLDASMRETLPQLVVDGECRRLAATLHAWLDRCERPRPPFEVMACERGAECTIGGVALRLRIDRIDAFENGGWAIVDYKSGNTVPPVRWFGARPEGTQLAVYAIASEALRVTGAATCGVGAAAGGVVTGTGTVVGASPPLDVRTDSSHAMPGTLPLVRALAFAQVKAGALRVRGMIADKPSWPELDEAGAVRGQGVSWDDALGRLRDGVEALAHEVCDGHAAVTPRDATVCRVCDLQSLCRIRGLDDGGSDDSTMAGDEL
ncbi:MAG: PD-(D/E)XK nuclease family protein [Casimicrobiaceae bacterium]